MVKHLLHYQRNLNNESCGCIYPNDPAFDEQYKISAQIISPCGNDAGSAAKAINDPIKAELDIGGPFCEGVEITFGNLSGIGCDGNTLEQGDDTLTYYIDFGDCTPIQDMIQ